MDKTSTKTSLLSSACLTSELSDVMRMLLAVSLEGEVFVKLSDRGMLSGQQGLYRLFRHQIYNIQNNAVVSA